MVQGADFGHTSPARVSQNKGVAKLSWAGSQVLGHPGQEVTVRVARGCVHPSAAASLLDANLELRFYKSSFNVTLYIFSNKYFVIRYLALTDGIVVLYIIS